MVAVVSLVLMATLKSEYHTIQKPDGPSTREQALEIPLGGTKQQEQLMKFSKVTMEPNNRMVRIGFGQNESRWFFRIDFWWFGIRITK